MRAPLAILFGLTLACCSSKGTTKKKAEDAKRPATTDEPAATADDAASAPREVHLPPAPPVPPPPLGLPEAAPATQNPTTAEKVALGLLLFFDERLSSDGSMACATCHQPELGWADGKTRSTTVADKPNLRHTPTLVNLAYAREFFWDGRVSPLEPAIDAHWRGQMSADPDHTAARLWAIPRYRAHFERTFPSAPTGERIVEALAAFVRTIRSGSSPFDRYEVGGGARTVSPSAIAGAKVFAEKAQCALCHPPPLYTDLAYHRPGAEGVPSAGAASQPPDPGRAGVTRDDRDRGAFKTPTLRGVVHSAPYFHDGRAETIEAAVARCLARGGPASADTPGSREPVHLTREEVDQVISFLQALAPAQEPYPRPELPRPAPRGDSVTP